MKACAKIQFSLFFLFCFSNYMLGQSSSLFHFQSKDTNLVSNNVRPSLVFSPIRFVKSFDGRIYLLANFKHLPSSSDREKMEKTDIHLLDYVGNNFYLTSFPQDVDIITLEHLGIQAVFELVPKTKLSLGLKGLDNNIENPKVGEIFISYYSDIDFLDISNILIDKGCVITFFSNRYHFCEVKVSKDKIYDIATLPFVKFIDHKIPLEPHNFISRTSIKSNYLDNNLIKGYTGNGVKIAINDDDFMNYDHIDFKGRTFWGPYNATQDTLQIQKHASHIAGTVGAGGNLNPIYTGFSPGGDLYNFRAKSANGIVFRDIPKVVNQGITLTQTSLGFICDPPSIIFNFQYTGNSRAVDMDINDFPKLLHVFSAGNFGRSNVTPCGGIGIGWRSMAGGYQMGKNVVTVGNLTHTDEINPSSSRGPAIDNRIKPDICAVGTDVISTNVVQGYFTLSGTSMSAPAITGLLAQMTEAYKRMYNESPDGGLLKAMLLNTADDLGNKGPDYTYGWGKANGRKMLVAVEKQQFLDGSISQNETDSMEVWIPANIATARIMLYWTDYPAMINSAKNLVNDLDLRLSDAASTQYFPWKLDPGSNPTVVSIQLPATKGIDTLNNMEQVEIENPTPGKYTIEIKGKEVPFGPQKYFLVYDFIKDTLQLTFPYGQEAFRPNEDLILRWDAYSDTGSFDIAYTLDKGRNWTNIATGVSGAQRFYMWTTPSQSSGQARIRITRGTQSSQSLANFTIAETPGNIQFARVCQDFVTMTWDAVPGAKAYDVFVLGEKYMDSVGTTSNTFFEPQIRYQNENWFSVRVRGDSGLVGRRAIAVRQQAGMLLNCAGVAPTANFILDTVLCDSQWVFLQDMSLKSPDSWQWAVSPSAGVGFIQNTADSSVNPVISFADTGTYQIRLRVVSQFGIDSTVQTVQIRSCNTAISEPALLNLRALVKLVPNPNDGYFRLRMQGPLAPSYQLELLDLQGRRQYAGEIWPQGERFEKALDFRHLARGIYFLRLSDGETSAVLKVVVR